MMCRDETSRSVALGLFGRIRRDATGDHPGRVDLKMRGTMPLVASARLWALKYGVAETGTLGAPRGAGGARRDRPQRQRRADRRVRHVTFLLLRQQLEDFHARRKVGNFVDPDALSRRERGLLERRCARSTISANACARDITGEVW